MSRPHYCPDDIDPDKNCPACGEPPEGMCRAINRGPEPKPLVEVILIQKSQICSEYLYNESKICSHGKSSVHYHD